MHTATLNTDWRLCSFHILWSHIQCFIRQFAVYYYHNIILWPCVCCYSSFIYALLRCSNPFVHVVDSASFSQTILCAL